jgi:calcium/calmodulin-dependent protein kinase I
MFVLCSTVFWRRDLKPENLLMTSAADDADLKIVDFGFAAVAHGDTLTSQCGTPGYIAPEILYGLPHGVYADAFAAFVVFVAFVLLIVV